MSPSEMRNQLIERLVVAKSELFVTSPTDLPIDLWTLQEIGHHINEVERLVARLHGQSAPLPERPF